MARALARHDALLREAIRDHDGYVFATGGDAFCAAFHTAADAVAAARDAQLALARETWPAPVRIKVRMALHTGAAELRDNDYFGQPLNRVARLLAAGHGGQVLLSLAAQDLVRNDLPAGVTLRDLGERRLKDLIRPERVYQLVAADLAADFPPLRTLDARSHNLPIQLTSFVGREREMKEVKALLRDARAVTLTGAGGSGKTRLSLQVAADVVDEFADGVWLVELAPLTEASLVAQSVAAVLGVKEQPGRSITQALIDHAKERELLVLLDNCEHLIEAAADVCQALLAACPRVRLLITSREGLRLPGETLYPVPPLAAPGPGARATVDTLASYAAVQLFVDRAVAVRATFRVSDANAPAVASICYHLDGIPLAIELAAARVRSMSVHDIDERLDERFRLLTGGARTTLPRQQTLRAAIEWSYDLLSGAEQALFRRLSVFAGGCTLRAAEEVCSGAGIDESAVLDSIVALVDKSLLLVEERNETTRYRFLETVQQYARDRLRDAAEESVWHGRHLAHFVALAEEARPQLRGKDQHAWLDRIEAEHDNLRAALTCASAPGADPASGLRLAAGIWWFWFVRGYLTEGRGWLSATVAAAPDGVADPARADALYGAGALAYGQSDYATARELVERSLAVFRSLGDRTGVGNALSLLGAVAKDQSQYERARALQEESLSIHREAGNRRGIAVTLCNLATISDDAGQLPAARARYAESLEIFRELGDEPNVALQLHNLAHVAHKQGDHATARTMQEQSLAIWRAFGDRKSVALALENLGAIEAAQGDRARARALLEESLEIRRALGDRRGTALSLRGLATVADDDGDRDRARVLYRESLSTSWSVGDRLSVAEALEGLAACHGDPGRAAVLWGGAERLREEIGAPIPPSRRGRYDRDVAATRSALGDEAAFDDAWRHGRAMAADRIVECALEAPAGSAAASERRDGAATHPGGG